MFENVIGIHQENLHLRDTIAETTAKNDQLMQGKEQELRLQKNQIL